MAEAIFRLKDLFGETLDTRDAAMVLAQEIAEANVRSVILDFDEVAFLSRSFADQLIKERVKLFSLKGATTQLINMEDRLVDVFQAVTRTQEKVNLRRDFPVVHPVSNVEGIEKVFDAL